MYIDLIIFYFFLKKIGQIFLQKQNFIEKNFDYSHLNLATYTILYVLKIYN